MGLLRRLFDFSLYWNISLIFLYIFSFKILGPINSSMLIAVIFYCYALVDPKIIGILIGIVKEKYIYRLIVFIFGLFSLSLLFCTFHNTFDLYFVKIFLVQGIQLLLGVFLIAIFKRQDLSTEDIELYIIYAFLAQSIIQVIVSATPSLLPYIYYFNGAQSINEAYTLYYGSGVRGVALSSGTGWSLALAYGVVFIIYGKVYLSDRIGAKQIWVGLLLILGIFFAGRTGFIGVLMAGVYFFFNPRRSLLNKFSFVVKILFYVLLFCLVMYLIFPVIVMHLVNNVLPFALEPFYKLYSNDSFETDSTNRLMEMWSQPITLKEFLIGSGHYFDPVTGSFYKQVDIGLFKNLYYWGIFGYISVILYQLVQLLPIGKIRIKGKIKTNNLYLFCMFLFLLLMDLKSISMGMNKMAFSIILLVAYFYSNDKKKTLSN